MNTPRVVMQETKKAFRAIDKRKDIESAVSALSNLKGVGPAMASGRVTKGQVQNVEGAKSFIFYQEHLKEGKEHGNVKESNRVWNVFAIMREPCYCVRLALRYFV